MPYDFHLVPATPQHDTEQIDAELTQASTAALAPFSQLFIVHAPMDINQCSFEEWAQQVDDLMRELSR
jgi:hypothetical protein